MADLDLNIQVLYMNNTFENLTLDEYQTQLFTFIYDQPVNAILISTYIPLFLIALFSNILIILVVSRYRYLRSVTNYFLVNLSVADLLVTLICMPVAVGQAVHSLWLYGEVMCKLSFYLQGVAVSAGVFTITAVSIERCLAIRHPMSRKIFNRRTTRKVILAVWSVSLILFAPLLFIRKTVQLTINGSSFEFCIESWPDNFSRRSFGTFCFIVVYAIPGFIVVLAYSLMGLRLCSRNLLPEYQLSHGGGGGGGGGGSPTTGYGLPNPDSASTNANSNANVNSAWQVSAAGGRLIRERRRVAKILLVLALVFAFCWFPYSVLSLILDLKSKTQAEIDPDFPDKVTAEVDPDGIVTTASFLLPFALLLGHVNSAVNPLLCCLLSKNFRRSVVEMIRHATRAVRSRPHCKIRMNFRKETPDSRDKFNSRDHVNSNRPRNHHAPDPPPPSESRDHDSHSHSGGGPNNLCNRVIPATNLNEIAPIPTAAAFDPNIPLTVLVADVPYFNQLQESSMVSSPTSSGYGSLRQSVDTLKDREAGQGPSVQQPFESKSAPVKVSHRTVFGFPTRNFCPSKKSGGEAKRVTVQVPSTIREESDSSQRTKGRHVHVVFRDVYYGERNSH